MDRALDQSSRGRPGRRGCCRPGAAHPPRAVGLVAPVCGCRRAERTPTSLARVMPAETVPFPVTVRRFPRWGGHPGRCRRREVRTPPVLDRLPFESRSGALGRPLFAADHGSFGGIRAWSVCPSGPARRPISVTDSQLVRTKGDRTSRTWQGRWCCRRHDTTVAVARAFRGDHECACRVGLSTAREQGPTQVLHIQFLHRRRRR